jgi:hypothetical protein
MWYIYVVLPSFLPIGCNGPHEGNDTVIAGAFRSLRGGSGDRRERTVVSFLVFPSFFYLLLTFLRLVRVETSRSALTKSTSTKCRLLHTCEKYTCIHMTTDCRLLNRYQKRNDRLLASKL